MASDHIKLEIAHAQHVWASENQGSDSGLDTVEVNGNRLILHGSTVENWAWSVEVELTDLQLKALRG